MTIQLTDEQHRAVQRGEPVRLMSAGLGEIVVLPATVYDDLQQAEAEQTAWAGLARKAASRWAEENPFE